MKRSPIQGRPITSHLYWKVGRVRPKPICVTLKHVMLKINFFFKRQFFCCCLTVILFLGEMLYDWVGLM